MKYFILAAIFFVNLAYSHTASYLSFTVDWSKPQQTRSLACDGKLNHGIEILIPGRITNGKKLAPESLIEFHQCKKDWRIASRSYLTKDKRDYTSIRFIGSSHCSISIREPVSSGITPRISHLEIAEGCSEKT